MNILEAFEYNQHFVAMMNIINKAKLFPPITGQIHHIIPRCWFKHNNLKVDNTSNNTVKLTFDDHKKVHQLAALCGLELWFRNSMRSASNYYFGESSFKGCTHTKESRKKMSIAKKGKLPSNLEDNHKLLKGKHKSQEFKYKLSKNNCRYWKDKKRDKEWCEKHSKAMKEYWVNKRNLKK